MQRWREARKPQQSPNSCALPLSKLSPRETLPSNSVLGEERSFRHIMAISHIPQERGHADPNIVFCFHLLSSRKEFREQSNRNQQTTHQQKTGERTLPRWRQTRFCQRARGRGKGTHSKRRSPARRLRQNIREKRRAHAFDRANNPSENSLRSGHVLRRGYRVIKFSFLNCRSKRFPIDASRVAIFPRARLINSANLLHPILKTLFQSLSRRCHINLPRSHGSINPAKKIVCIRHRATERSLLRPHSRRVMRYGIYRAENFREHRPDYRHRIESTTGNARPELRTKTRPAIYSRARTAWFIVGKETRFRRAVNQIAFSLIEKRPERVCNRVSIARGQPHRGRTGGNRSTGDEAQTHSSFALSLVPIGPPSHGNQQRQHDPKSAARRHGKIRGTRA